MESQNPLDVPLPPMEPSPDHFDPDKVCNYLRIHSIRSSLMFLASCAYKEITQGRRIRILYTLDHSSFSIDKDNEPINPEMIPQIQSKMIEFINSGHPIESFYVLKNDLIQYFKTMNYNDKVTLLLNNKSEKIEIVKFNNFIDFSLDSQYIHDLSKLGLFDVQFSEPGFFIRYPGLLSNGVISEWKGAPLQHFLIMDTINWSEREVHSNSIENLNELVNNEEFDNVNQKSIEFAFKNVTEICDSLCRDFDKKRLITIAGPSSSGKSTFSKVISNELTKRGYDVLIFMMDNYYLDVPDTPKDADGKYDFESINALHLDMMVQHLHCLLKGESIKKRIFNFAKGIGYDHETETLSLSSNGFLIIEGINALNPVLLEKLGASLVTKIYVGPMTPISIDSEHLFRTSDLLLIRRIIRDFHEREYSARRVVGWWPDISIGEARNITPNIQYADLFYNSSLVLELSALSAVVIPLLEQSLNSDKVEECDKDPYMKSAVTSEAQRLLTLLYLFQQIPPKKLPDSCCIYNFVNIIAEKLSKS